MRSGFRAPFKRHSIISTSPHRGAQVKPASPAPAAQRGAPASVKSDEAAAERVSRWAEDVRMLVRSEGEVTLPRGSTLAAVLATSAYLIVSLLVLWSLVAMTLGR